ncbi:MAG: MFS transporter [Armatimonadia bacterium]|nr:MFS transporter [Armatimonadia bacterium]
MLVRSIRDRLSAVHPEFPKYLLAIAFMAVCGGIFENTYYNYLWDQFQIGERTRGHLELVREFPGLLNVLFLAIFAAIPETRVAAIAAAVTCVGMAGFGIAGHNWWVFLVLTLAWGTGSHIIMPIEKSLTMELGGETARGRRLGQVGAVRVAGSIVGAAAVLLVFASMTRPDAAAVVEEGARPPVLVDEMWRYDASFYVGALACALAAWMFWSMRQVGSRSKRPRLVLKREYWLYYVLSVLFGARKQVFLTFGRWVLVKIFLTPPPTFAWLWIAASVIGIWFNPWIGKVIDRVGERRILVIDSILLMVVCFGYGVSTHLPVAPAVQQGFVLAFFVLDQILFGLQAARSTYMGKIAQSKEDLTGSLSMGVTLDHVVAATIPSLGGWIWWKYGYEWVFVGAGGIAILMTFFANMIRTPDHRAGGEQSAEPPKRQVAAE